MDATFLNNVDNDVESRKREAQMFSDPDHQIGEANAGFLDNQNIIKKILDPLLYTFSDIWKAYLLCPYN